MDKTVLTQLISAAIQNKHAPVLHLNRAALQVSVGCQGRANKAFGPTYADCRGKEGHM